MKLAYFSMPVHPLERDWVQTLKEDREAVILADSLGYEEAFIGEHLTDKAETITNSLQFLATLIPVTTRIKLGTGTANLSQAHPVLIANHAAMFDHLCEGRFIFGVSAGALPSDAEALGILDEDRNRIFAEAIDAILAIWEGEPPYDIDLPGNRFKISTRRTSWPEVGSGRMHKPFQKPRPEIVGTVVAPFSPGVIEMGKRDFHPLSANFLLPRWVKTHWQNYAEGKRQVGQAPRVADWRIAKTIFVADDDQVAAEYGRHAPNSPYRYYYTQLRTKLTKVNRHIAFKEHKDQPDSEITDDFVMDRLVIWGSVNKVVDEILAFRETVGDFGTLVYAGLDWADPQLARRSMTLMAEQVMPKVNEALKANAA